MEIQGCTRIDEELFSYFKITDINKFLDSDIIYIKDKELINHINTEMYSYILYIGKGTRSARGKYPYINMELIIKNDNDEKRYYLYSSQYLDSDHVLEEVSGEEYKDELIRITVLNQFNEDKNDSIILLKNLDNVIKCAELSRLD